MKNNNKDCKNAVILPETKFVLKLPNIALSDISSGESVHLYKELTSSSDCIEKNYAIEKILSENLSQNDSKVLVEVLFSSLLESLSHRPFRRHLVKSLNSLEERDSNVYNIAIQGVLASNLHSCVEVSTYTNFQLIILEEPSTVDGIKSNICLTMLENLTPVIQSIWRDIQSSQYDSAEARLHCRQLNNILRNMNSMLSKFRLTNFQIEMDSDFSSLKNDSILSLLLNIINSSLTSIDIDCSCGSLWMKLVFESDLNKLDLLQCILEKKKVLYSVSDSAHLSLFHGILCHIDDEIMFDCSLESGDFDVEILNSVLNYLNSTQISCVAVLSCKVLKTIIAKLLEMCKSSCLDINSPLHQKLVKKYSIHSGNSKNILDTLWILFDHFLDCVKHQSRETFTLYLKVQLLLNQEEALEYLLKYARSLCLSLLDKKSLVALNCVAPYVGVELLQFNSDLVPFLFGLLSDPSYANAASSLIESLFVSQLSRLDNQEWCLIWLPQLVDNFNKDMLAYGYEILLKKFFCLLKDPMKPIVMLYSEDVLSDRKLCILIICVKICFKLHTFAHDYSNKGLWKGVVPFSLLKQSLESGDEVLSILAFELICNDAKSTESFDQRELNAIFHFIKRNIACQDPSFRQKFINNVKKVFNRLCDSLSSKKIKVCSGQYENDAILLYYEEFINDLFVFLCSNLSCASFLRKSSSLHLLDVLIDLSRINILMSKLLDKLSSDLSVLKYSLILILNDSYESNKEMALKLLKKLPADEVCPNMCRCLMNSVWEMASSIKPPDSFTGSYLLMTMVNCSNLKELLCSGDSSVSHSENKMLAMCSLILLKVKEEVAVCEDSLFTAASSAPMYGLLMCLRSLFAGVTTEDVKGLEHFWVDLIQQILNVCFTISNLVSNIVKNSSPEGHLPLSLDTEYNHHLLKEAESSVRAVDHGFIETQGTVSCEVIKEQAVSSQLLLACGWRCIKEIALFFGFIIQGVGDQGHSWLHLLDKEQVKSIGNFFITQLMETKHRGAFEQTYTGFEMYCKKLWKSPNFESVPSKYLNDVLTSIQSGNVTRLCATRRSAGVPFIVQAIITTEPASLNSYHVQYSLNTLLDMTSQPEDSEGKIHALNILRTLFRDSRIGEQVLPFTAEGIKAALRGYTSSSWSVRNSSSLLYSALVTRMLGVKKTQEDLHIKNTVSALVFFKRYPTLFDFFLENLRSSVKEMDDGRISSSSYPILLLLARFSPCTSDGFSVSIDTTPFIPLVIHLSSSPSHFVRKLASKAIIPLVTPLSVSKIVSDLASSLTPLNQNAMHGSLLCIINILQSYSSQLLKNKASLAGITESIQSIIWVIQKSNSCFMTRAVGFTLFDFLIRKGFPLPSDVLKIVTTSCFSLLLTLNQDCTNAPGSIIAVESAMALFFSVTSKYKKDNSEILNLLGLPCPQIRVSCLQQILRFPDLHTLSLLSKVSPFIKYGNESHQCKMLSYQLISEIISSSDFIEKAKDFDEDFDELLRLMLDDIERSSSMEDSLAHIVKCSAHLLHLQLKVGLNTDVQKIMDWCVRVSELADSAQSSAVRIQVAEGCGRILAVWSHLKELKGNLAMDEIELLLIQTSLKLMVDDDSSIRAIMSAHVDQFLSKRRPSLAENGVLPNARPPSIVMDQLLQYTACKESGRGFSVVLSLALEEESSESFGQSQEDDRVFEKSENQFYREDVEIAKSVAKALSIAVDDGRDRFTDVFRLNLKTTEQLLLLPIPPSILKGIENETVYLSEFMKLLKRDIEFILDQFDVLKEDTPFMMKRFGDWLQKLAKKTLIWSVLKPLSSLDIEPTLKDILNQSVLKPVIFRELYNLL